MAVDKYKLFEKIGYEPFYEQRQFHDSEARFRVAACGRRFGKSLSVARDVMPKLFEPNTQIWVVGPTYSLAEKEFKVIWNDLMVRRGLGKDKRIRRAYSVPQGQMYIKFPWGSVIEAKSADKPETLVGEALDHVIMSEAAKHQWKTWDQYIRPALADKQGSADFVSTPEGYANWFYEMWQLGQQEDLPEYDSWRFPSWNNIISFPGGREDPEIKLLERTLTPERFAQEIGAEFGSFVGKIFSEFQEETHVKRLDFRPELPNYMCIDFGWANPLAAIEFQITPRDEIRVWREHYESRLTLEEHINRIENREQPEGYHLDIAFGDCADPEGVEYISQHLVGCWAENEAKSNWRAGIDLMKQFMRTPSHGEVKFFVDPACSNTIRELNNYRTKEETEGKKENTAAGVAERIDDHALDALRYGLMHIYELGASQSLDSVESANRPSSPLRVVESGDSLITANGYFTKDTSITQGGSF
jgi:hypothetical protein